MATELPAPKRAEISSAMERPAFSINWRVETPRYSEFLSRIAVSSELKVKLLGVKERSTNFARGGLVKILALYPSLHCVSTRTAAWRFRLSNPGVEDDIGIRCYAKTYIETATKPRRVFSSGKIAVVTLVQSSNEDISEPAELEQQIREKLQLSRITKQWSIEKIAILDELPPETRILRAPREDDVIVP